MKEHSTLVFAGGDLRTVAAARRFAAEGRHVLLTGFDRYTSPPEHTKEDALLQFVHLPEQAIPQGDAVILPMPYTKGGGVLLAPFSGTAMPLDAVFRLAESAKIVCGGMLPEEEDRFFDYCDESMLLRNADVTAEGALILAGQTLPICLNGARVAVLGYGRIGKRLAAKARALGCTVTVAARKESDHALIRMCGHDAVDFSALPAVLACADVVFNTVPAEIFSESVFTALGESVPLIDLAGGIKLRGERILPAPGVPGKYAPETAGRILKESVERILVREGILDKRGA